MLEGAVPPHGRNRTSSQISCGRTLAFSKRMMMRTISREALKKMMDDGRDFVLVDARTHEGFDEEHLPGAVRMPANRLGESMLRRYRRDRTVVTYCSGWACESSTIAAKKLERLGFTDVLDFKGGIEDWKKAKYPLVKG